MKTIQTREAVQSTLALFLNRCPNVKRDLLTRLKYICEKFQDSSYFQTHEASFFNICCLGLFVFSLSLLSRLLIKIWLFLQVVGSSILIIYDSKHVGAWMIDFAKTLSLPDGVNVTHRKPWQQGNHEEGYLTGIDNLIHVMPYTLLSLSISSANVFLFS